VCCSAIPAVADAVCYQQGIQVMLPALPTLLMPAFTTVAVIGTTATTLVLCQHTAALASFTAVAVLPTVPYLSTALRD
jgi:hypothetical protein